MEPKDIAREIFVSIYSEAADWFEIYWSVASHLKKVKPNAESQLVKDALGITGRVAESEIERVMTSCVLYHTLGIIDVAKLEADDLKQRFDEAIKIFPLPTAVSKEITKWISKVFDSLPSLGPSLELGIKDGKPYINVNGKPLPKLEERFFVDLCLLAAALKKGDGSIARDEFEWSSNYQGLSELREFVRFTFPKLMNISDNEEIIETIRGYKKIKLKFFKTVDIQNSICLFESSHKSVTVDITKNFPKEIPQETDSTTLLGKKVILSREFWSYLRHKNVIWKSCKMLGWKYDDGWEKEYRESKETLESLRILINMRLKQIK